MASGVNMAGLITLFMAIISWGQPTCHSNTIVNMEIIVRGTSNKLSLKLHSELINFSSKEFYLGVVYIFSHISGVTLSRLTSTKSWPIENVCSYNFYLENMLVIAFSRPEKLDCEEDVSSGVEGELSVRKKCITYIFSRLSTLYS